MSSIDIDRSFGFWKTDILPDNLEDMLKETMINNSFTEEDTTDQLTESMKSSFAYLYRYQELSSHFKQINYRTREFLQITTYSKIQDTVREQNEILDDPNASSEDKENAKKIITELLEIQFGDFYLDKNDRVCVDIDYNIIMPVMRDSFRSSLLYGKELTLEDIAANKGIFIETAIVLVDNYVHTDIKILPKDKCTTIIFKELKSTDIYRKENGTQFEHDLTILFVENSFYKEISFPIPIDEDYLSGGAGSGKLYISETTMGSQSEINHLLTSTEGIFVACCRSDYYKPDGKKYHVKSALIPEIGMPEDNFGDYVIDLNQFDYTFGNWKDEHAGEIITVSFFYLEDFHKFSSGYYPDGLISQRMKMYTGTHDDGYTGYQEGYAMPFFIPTKDNFSDPYEMPVPKANMFVIKNLRESDGYKRDVVGFDIDIGVESYYPNIYKVTDTKMKDYDNYYVFYFYKPGSNRYTNLFKFYEEWMTHHYNMTFEEALNKVYLNMEQITTSLDGERIDAIYSVFKKLIEYKDYNYCYGTSDFIHLYTGDDISLQYKVARMKEFVRADWHVLEKYVKREKKNMSLYHFFTNTINLAGRKRRSTRLEDPNNPYLFASKVVRTTSSDPEALRVSDSKAYDFDTEIYIDDARIGLEDVEVGEYVKCIDLTNRYVLAFKNDDFVREIPFHIFVDGILVENIIRVRRYGMDYIYIPMKYLTTDSYIMLERDFFITDPIKVDVTVSDTDTFVTAHFIEKPQLAYTMNDVYIETSDGRIVPKDKYELRIEKNHVGYSMYDERHDELNKYGIVTDVQFRMISDLPEYGTNYKICMDKDTVSVVKVAPSTGYPRVYLEDFDSVDELNYVRMFCNGRLVDNSLYKMGKKGDATIIQSRIKCEKGDTFVFEITPYSRKLILSLDNIPASYILDFSNGLDGRAILDKPFNPEYYEIYVNGRRLGLPNAFELGPHHGVLRGLHSTYKLEIYEKERDFEYFGYDYLDVDPDTHKYEYYYTPSELINLRYPHSSGYVLPQEERDLIVENYINQVKHPDAIIKPNVIDEENLNYLVQFNIAEDMAIFYYEDLLPLFLANPDEVQFNKEYLEGMYPYLCEVYLKDDPVEENKYVFFVDPNIATHSNSNMLGDTYYLIDIDTMDMTSDTTYVYLVGENGIITYE